ncbi:MAG: peptide chain release factor N(5)-glutamine methyltransferase [Ruminococcus sp.]|nr:peptide chain release factor N(5)-glutamine methyltransferase [Ruminococcus sp.]
MVNYTYNDIILSLESKLSGAGITNSHWEARELAGCALGFNCRGRFDGGKLADPAQVKACAMLLARRMRGEPLQYIIGEWDFCGESFDVGPGVLIPRSDTETLIDEAVKAMKGCSDLTVADLCAGTGCIGITLARLLDCAQVFCLEKHEAAFDYLTKNIKRRESLCKPIQADVLDPESLIFVPMCDLIISNPPYINAEDMKKLQKEVTFEPREALDGGEDGFDFYRGITRLWKKKLKPGGVMIFEIGAGQEDEVMEIMITSGLKDVRVRRDMAGINRCVIGKNIVQENVNLYEQLDKNGSGL